MGSKGKGVERIAGDATAEDLRVLIAVGVPLRSTTGRDELVKPSGFVKVTASFRKFTRDDADALVPYNAGRPEPDLRRKRESL